MALINIKDDEIVVNQLDLSQSLTLAMQAEGINDQDIQRVINTLFDALTNNCD
ncbi:hypothetical protein SCRM01_253 [Synechococcus phage S-CRM01]|uniref:hypothetical protein n=1 Tax=Synechococcus phage S-CRM01 TaxID=1026955 RepID=UPI000209E44E|nr:hypothetical protein SCRM01_253 [Synechococcus phage S-CRM01]AEC53199.1 hypothetical protein SCRM01_253 [Synechococcus phage S-CRM01]